MRFSKLMIGVVLVLLVVALIAVPGAHAANGLEGKTYFTTVNIWFEKPQRIYSTNYHRGAILLLGEKVLVTAVSGKAIHFTGEDGTNYTIAFMKSHHSQKATVESYFNQYFSKQSPILPGSPYHQLTADEKWHVKTGSIKIGMSKAAVLMAYGYPPSHRTPSLKNSIWVYWVNRFVKKNVYFKDGRVYKIK